MKALSQKVVAERIKQLLTHKKEMEDRLQEYKDVDIYAKFGKA